MTSLTTKRRSFQFSLPTLLTAVLVASLHTACGHTANGHAAAEAQPSTARLSPTALTGDAGDGGVYLRWNLQLEDERVVGWVVQMLHPRQATLTESPLSEPAMVVRGLSNGTSYTFAVAGVLRDGRLTPLSNTVTVTPRPTGEAKIVALIPPAERRSPTRRGKRTMPFPLARSRASPLAITRPRSSFPTDKS